MYAVELTWFKLFSNPTSHQKRLGKRASFTGDYTACEMDRIQTLSSGVQYFGFAFAAPPAPMPILFLKK